jgi:hypothetical protein
VSASCACHTDVQYRQLCDVQRSQPCTGLPHQVSLPELSGDVFLPEHEGKLLRLVPQREGHVLELHWSAPPCDHLYR